jgi:hypothetical protein
METAGHKVHMSLDMGQEVIFHITQAIGMSFDHADTAKGIY